MPIALAFTTKAALMMGVIVGGTVAVLSNKEKILELLAEYLQKGADFCNEQIEKNRIQMASQMEDGELDFDQEKEAAENEPEATSTGYQRNSVADDESGTEAILTEDSDMDGWQLAHLSESEFSESYDELDSEPVSRATSWASNTSSYGRMSVVSVD